MRISAYVARTCGLTPKEAQETAETLIGRTVYPALKQGLLGVREAITEHPDEAALATDVDLDQIAANVRQLLSSDKAL